MQVVLFGTGKLKDEGGPKGKAGKAKGKKALGGGKPLKPVPLNQNKRALKLRQPPADTAKKPAAARSKPAPSSLNESMPTSRLKLQTTKPRANRTTAKAAPKKAQGGGGGGGANYFESDMWADKQERCFAKWLSFILQVSRHCLQLRVAGHCQPLTALRTAAAVVEQPGGGHGAGGGQGEG